MARTADLISLVIEVTKGNGLADLVTEDFVAQTFQADLANGLDANKAVRMKRQVAVLGARGDYVMLKAFTTAATAGGLIARSAMYVEAIDFTGVPTAVQHTVFGEYSPFVTPKSSMQESMLDGIDRQEIGITVNQAVTTTACKTAVNQKVRGVADSRVTCYCGTDDAWTEAYIKLKPNSDGVFVLPAGGIIWAEPDVNVFDIENGSF